MRAVANAHDATPAQVALAWVISHDNVVAIPGASSVAQLEANVAAADLELTADEIDAPQRARPTRSHRRAAPARTPRSRSAGCCAAESIPQGQVLIPIVAWPVGTYGSGFAPPANRSAIQWIMSSADGAITPAWLWPG